MEKMYEVKNSVTTFVGNENDILEFVRCECEEGYDFIKNPEEAISWLRNNGYEVTLI